MSAPPTVGGYSFYLNVVVLSTTAETGAKSDSSVDAHPPAEKEEKLSNDTEENEDEASDEPALVNEPATPVAHGETAMTVSTNKQAENHMKLLIEGKSLVDFAFGRRSSRPKSADSSKGNNPVKDGRGFINSLGNSISKSSSNISKRASRFVANKTMVSRAQKAVVECIPLVTEEIGVEMSISKRFQQGPVFVLEVDMKGCKMLELLEKVLGEEAAKHYTSVKEGLEFLDMPEATEAFLKEILPKLRKAMMDKMSEIVPGKMKQNKAYADLEIQCVALEDAEEAKWLYNFLAFIDEMK